MIAGIVAGALTITGSVGLYLSQTASDLPGWVGPVLTPTAAALLLVSGILMRTSVHEADMDRMWKLYETERTAREKAEDREREALRATLPALQAASNATDRALTYAQKAVN